MRKKFSFSRSLDFFIGDLRWFFAKHFKAVKNGISEDNCCSEYEESWLSENIRIIISIIIVVAIAGGIYSYSKRVEESSIEKAKSEQVINEEASVK